MATDAKQLVQSLYDDVMNNGHLDRIEDLLAPDFMSHTPQGDLKGVAGFRSYVEAWRAAFPDVHCDVIDPIQEGNRVAWRVHATGTHKRESFGLPATGSSVDFESMHHAYARDGELVEHWMVMDLAGVFDQLRRET